MIETASRICEERLKKYELRIQTLQQILARQVLQREPVSAEANSQLPSDTQLRITPRKSNRLAQSRYANSTQDVPFVGKNADRFASVTREGTENGALTQL